MTKIIEQRKAKRYRLEMPAELRFKDEGADAEVSINLKTRDISSSGACTIRSDRVEVGAEMEISLEIPLEKLRYVTNRVAKVKLNGVVVRISKSDMALSFGEKHDFHYMDSGKIIDKDQSGLTGREQEIIAKIAEGISNRQIAEELLISENTVRAHLHNVFMKINVKDRLQAALWANSNL